MLREAELFVMAETMLVEVLGRIRPEEADLALPSFLDPSGPALSMRAAVEQQVRDDVALTGLLTGADVPADGLSVPEAADGACRAAEQVVDGGAPAGPQDGTVGDVLLRATVARSLLAHYVAAHLGSTACPLPEELARPLWELTSPEAAAWRRLGWFRDPLPLPDHVSWRDRFLLTAGHPAHPVPH